MVPFPRHGLPRLLTQHAYLEAHISHGERIKGGFIGLG
jgi:hypothetical protein